MRMFIMAHILRIGVRQPFLLPLWIHTTSSSVSLTLTPITLSFPPLPSPLQCTAQLKALHREGLRGNAEEFAAYDLLYTALTNRPKADLQHSMAR